MQVKQHGALSQQVLELKMRGFELGQESERLQAVLEALEDAPGAEQKESVVDARAMERRST